MEAETNSIVKVEEIYDLPEEETNPDIKVDEEEKKLSDLKNVVCNFQDGFDALNMFFGRTGLYDVFREKKTRSEAFMRFQWYLFVASILQSILYIGLELTQFYVSMMSDSDNKILEVFGMMPCTVVTILGAMKSVLLVTKKAKLCKLVESLEEMWPDTEYLPVKKIVVENMVKTKKFIVFYMAQITILAILWTYKSPRRWDQSVELPYVVWHPFDIHASVLNYVAAYISQVYCGLFVCILMAATDATFCLLVSQVCMHLQLLKRDLTLLVDDPTGEEYRRVVVKHDRLLGFVMEIEDVFSFPMFANFMGSTLLLCMQLFSFTLAPMNEAFKYGLFVVTSLSQISIICFYGDKLTEESVAIRFSAYSSDWAIASNELKNLVMMVQIRASNPTSVSAMGFMDVNMGTLSSILSTSWSYFMLLHNVYSEV
ncbi:odorant receptor 85c-like [Arctopsyche grandis]|uniref:odorant receptor 85c-like n=1 Tax=Arctopsyche grandis TaxID=121162 RepID=UPI00406D6918